MGNKAGNTTPFFWHRRRADLAPPGNTGYAINGQIPPLAGKRGPGNTGQQKQ